MTKDKRIASIEAESGLIDDCKYMVYLNEGYEHEIYGDSFPIESKKVLNEYMKDVNEVKKLMRL